MFLEKLRTGKTMREIYKIKRECSRHLKTLTPEERIKEANESMAWFEEQIGRKLTSTNKTTLDQDAERPLASTHATGQS